jgi:hypothetical protein
MAKNSGSGRRIGPVKGRSQFTTPSGNAACATRRPAGS